MTELSARPTPEGARAASYAALISRATIELAPPYKFRNEPWVKRHHKALKVLDGLAAMLRDDARTGGVIYPGDAYR